MKGKKLRHGDLFTQLGHSRGNIFMVVCDGKNWFYTCMTKGDYEPFKGNLIALPRDTWESSEQYIGNMMDIIKNVRKR